MSKIYTKANVTRGFERMYVHPYAYNPMMGNVWSDNGKIHWITMDQGILITPVDLKAIPLISYTIKNLGYKWKSALSSLWWTFTHTNGMLAKIRKVKAEAYDYLIRDWQHPYCYYYPVKAIEVFDRMGLKGTYNLDSHDFDNTYLCPSDLSIELSLEWEQDKRLHNEMPSNPEAREREFWKIGQYAEYKEWRQKMLDSGYAIGYIVELDT